MYFENLKFSHNELMNKKIADYLLVNTTCSEQEKQHYLHIAEIRKMCTKAPSSSKWHEIHLPAD